MISVMSEKSEKTYIDICNKYYLHPGFLYVTQEPSVITTVLGSCISVCLYDTKMKYGGMNHYLYPQTNNSDQATTRYGNISIRVLYQTFIEFGSDPADLVAQIIGGAYCKSSIDSKRIAEENTGIAEKILNKAGIRIISETTGGIVGRKIVYFTEYNKLIISNIPTIRATDFYNCGNKQESAGHV